MVVKGFRYGETSGMCCGPVCGPTFAELMVYDNEGNSSFILASNLDCDLQIVLSDYPLFDIMYNAFLGSAANFHAEMEKADKLTKSKDDYDIYDEEEEGYGHYYPGMAKAVNLAVMLLRDVEFGNITEKEAEEYIGKNLDDMDVPVAYFVEERA